MASSSQSGTAPPVVKGDRIVPMHLFDDTAPNHFVLISVTLCFEAVLQPDVIHSALVRLLETGEWRKLGGRLRRNNDTGRLEIHIPESFTEARPAVRYHHEKYDMNFKDHELASQFPLPSRFAKTDKSIWNDFGSLTIPPGSPPSGVQKLADMLSRDEPQLSLRINSFRDATLVSWSFLHNMGDAQIIGLILKAWSDVMCGRKVPDRIDAFEDVFAKFSSTAPKEQLHLADKLAGVESKVFKSGNAWDPLYTAKTETKSIFLQRSVIGRIRQRAIADLKANGFPPEVASRNDPSTPFLSEGDVLVAWLCKHALTKFAPSTPEPVTIVRAYDTRGRVPSAFTAFDLSGKSPIYIGNATLRAYVYVPSSLVTKEPLGVFSAAFRTQVSKQTTPEQVHARAAVDYKMLTSAEGARASFNEEGSARFFFTDWSSAQVYEKVDFSAAAVGGRKPLLVSGIHSQAVGIGNIPLNTFQISSKNHEGSLYVEGCMTAEAWEALEKDLDNLNKFSSL